MSRAELFSYLAAFVTIVLAIAMTDMINSTHRLIRARKRIKWDARPLVFAAVVALAVISEFFSLWSKVAVEQISMGRLLWLLATPSIFALLAYSVLPDECPECGVDLSQFYEEERRTWVVLFLLAALLDTARTVEEYISKGWPLGDYVTFIGPFLVVMFVAFALIGFSRSRLWNWVGLILLLGAALSAVLGWTIKAVQ